MQYDLLPNASKLTMPVLLIVGDQDANTPPEHVKILYDALPGSKEIHIIKGAAHVFLQKDHLDEIKRLMMHWIDTWMK